MLKKLRSTKRGSIALALVFSVMIAVVMLGTMRVSMTLSSNNKGTEKQYPTIQTLRSITEVSCYSYVHDLMACIATQNMNQVMPGTPDTVVYMRALTAIQNELSLDAAGAGGNVDFMGVEEVPAGTVWRVQNAEVAVSGAEIDNAEVLTVLLAPVAGREHKFQLRLKSNLDLNFHSPDAYLGIDEARIPLYPVYIEVQVKARSELVVSNLVVEGLYLYVTRSESADGSGDITTIATMSITDDGEGSGVHIYREES